jgi:MFS family permease
MVSEQSSKDSSNTLKKMYWYQMISNFGSGIASPFLPYYAASLDFSSSELGILQGVQNVFPNLFQLYFGRLSDRLHKRIIFIVLGNLISSIMFFFMIGETNPPLFIMLVSVQSVMSAMITPIWGAKMTDISQQSKRGLMYSNFALLANIAMLFSGAIFIIYTYLAPIHNYSIYYIPFFFAGILGITSSLIIFKEKDVVSTPQTKKSSNFKILLKTNPNFRYFLTSQAIFNFGMSLCWPLYYLTTVRVLNASYYEIGIINIVSLIGTVFTVRRFGKIMDRSGFKIPIIITRFLYLPIPLVYAFANSVYDIYILNLVVGVGSGMSTIAFLAYLMDLAPIEYRAQFVGFYNMIIGVITFVGSLIGGFIAQYFIEIISLVIGLEIVYFLSFGVRLVGAVMSLKIKTANE